MLFKKQEKTGFDLLEKRFKNVKVWDKSIIKENYGKRFPDLTAAIEQVLRKFTDVDFLIVFKEKGQKGREKVWYSWIQGRVAINASFYLGNLESDAKFQKTVAEFRSIRRYFGEKF